MELCCVCHTIIAKSVKIFLFGVVGYINFGSHNAQRRYGISTANPPGKRYYLAIENHRTVLSPST